MYCSETLDTFTATAEIQKVRAAWRRNKGFIQPSLHYLEPKEKRTTLRRSEYRFKLSCSEWNW